MKYKLDTSTTELALDWMAFGMGLSVLSMFPTAIAWVWSGGDWGWKALLTEAIVFCFFWLIHAVMED